MVKLNVTYGKNNGKTMSNIVNKMGEPSGLS